jgi:hypothetical protein
MGRNLVRILGTGRINDMVPAPKSGTMGLSPKVNIFEN